MRKNQFIFQDTGGARWLRIKILSFTGILLAVAALILFFRALLATPPVDSPTSLRDLKLQIKAYEKGHRPQVKSSENDRTLTKLLQSAPPVAHGRGKVGQTTAGAGGVRAAFFTGSDEAAFRSLKQHSNALTHLCPDWLTFTDIGAGPVQDPDAGMERLAGAKAFKLMPVLSNEKAEERVPEAVESLMYGSPEQRAAFIGRLASLLTTIHASGVVIDWQEVDGGPENELSDLIADIAKGLKVRGLETWLCVPVDQTFDDWDFEKMTPFVSRFVALLHDENGETDQAGPIASKDWVEGWMSVLSRTAPPEKWIVSLASYGIDWAEDQPTGEQISFADCMSRAGNAGCSDVKNEAPFFNGAFSYFYSGKSHDVWFLDAASFANSWNEARDYGFGGVMLNRMGTEDPAVWGVMTSGGTVQPSDLPAAIPGGDAITSIGAGEVVSYDPGNAPGHRTFTSAEEEQIAVTYDQPPSYPTFFRLGATDPAKVALTFDDGPDPEWTPQILDILKSRGVKATFFVVGKEAERNPDLIHRIIAEGHEIGNHSYSHPNLAESPEPLIKLELNATQRLLESLTGRSTTLFRPPYNADSHPSKLEELLPIEIAESLGYMTVLENIDPRDWDKPGADELVRRVKQMRASGNIVLLHDGGGDRDATVQALPRILDFLKERGDSVVTVGGLLGVDNDKIMPPVNPSTESVHLFASGAGFQFFHLLQDYFHAFLVVATTLVLIRTLLILYLARRHKPAAPVYSQPMPPVSVLIPAYNEEKVIAKTIRALLSADYPGELEIVVIDDGSTDHTAQEVEAVSDPRVRLIRQTNAGKSHALQNGVDQTQNEFLVFVDADTQLDTKAIRMLVASFVDDKIGAVSGHARVGNRRRFLARCQDLEYVSGFNLDRRAYAAWNCITVAPGAISALRRSAIVAAGGFSYDTLAEDTDLTLSIHKAGYRVEYQRLAVAYTEAPETFATLAKQRFRWAYGTLQCAFKHRDIIFNPRYKALGWFSLPGIWFFQVILVAVAPFIDLLFLQSIIFGHAMDILPYFVAFLLCDLLLAAVAVKMEGLRLDEALRIIPQRFVYRPLLSYVIWKSIVHALRGAWVGWGKLQRTATVTVP